jgi:3-oxoacyl-(acyl-carrier-protein) synthase
MDVKRAGILVGSAFGGMSAFVGGCTAVLESYRKMNPFCIPFAITNMGSAMLAMDTGLMGPNYSVSSACATGNYCMMNAVNHIRAGEADLMLAGATDAAILPEGTLRDHARCRDRHPEAMLPEEMLRNGARIRARMRAPLQLLARLEVLRCTGERGRA